MREKKIASIAATEFHARLRTITKRQDRGHILASVAAAHYDVQIVQFEAIDRALFVHCSDIAPVVEVRQIHVHRGRIDPLYDANPSSLWISLT